MPDTRRITGPEETQSPFAFCPQFLAQSAEAFSDGKRRDGRKAEADHRPVFLKAGLISQAKGSAFAELDKTKVVCAVYGPHEVARREDFSMQGQISCEVKFAPFSCRVRRQHVQDGREKDLSTQLLEALEPAVRLDSFPKSQVDVFVTVLENDGSALSAAITCASLALADAGIEMYDLVVACTARIHGTSILVDPSFSEENLKTVSGEKPGGQVTLGFMPSLRQVSALCYHGDTDLDVLSQATQRCQDTCHKLYQVVQDTLVKSVEQRMNNS
ncbi:exosome complex component MTR3-like [Littorina saxatilis]|uniref:Exosome complex component MTR3 n=1 Tax=Littorina saxatilis TaxID=31220 RepID=A0AAN9AQJ3_9CAEN